MLQTLYTTDRLSLQLSDPSLAKRVAEYYNRNKEFLKESEPLREKNFYTEEFQRRALARDLRNARELSALRLWLLPLGEEETGDILGSVAMMSIMYGPFRSAFLGYHLDRHHTGQGLMQEALRQVISIAFEDIGLHRLEANIMPRNTRSLKLAERLGFENEGLAKKYLCIDGVWEDHIRMVLLNDEE